jgi:uncharacterized RDD family membrane protein YckC
VNSKLQVATIRSRILAFFIDIFVVYFIRSFYLWSAFVLFVKDRAKVFLVELAGVFDGIEIFESIDAEQLGYFFKVDDNIFIGLESIFSNVKHLEYFLKSDFFYTVLFFVLGAFVISILYNYICFFYKKASLGQLSLGLRVVDSDGNETDKLHFFLRAVLNSVPWMIMGFVIFHVLMGQSIAEKDVGFIALFVFIWFDLAFFTTEKYTMHDLISGTRVVFNNPDRKETIFEKLLPNPRGMFGSLKGKIKKEFERTKNMKDEVKNAFKKKK